MGVGIALMCLIWGSTWIVIREGLHDLPPLKSAGVRFLLAAVVLAAVARPLARREGGERPTRGLVLWMGCANFALSYAIVYWSETVLPSGLVSVLWATFPMMMAIGGHFFLGERLIGAQWLGFVVGFVGVACLFVTDFAALGEGAIAAALIVLLSPGVSTLGTLYVKRHGERTSSVLLNRDGLLVGALLLCLAGATLEADQPMHWTPRALLSVSYLALFGTIVTFGLYFWLMRYASASSLSLVAYVVPGIALALGALVGDEPVGPSTLLGLALILAGVILVRKKPRAPERAVRSGALVNGRDAGPG